MTKEEFHKQFQQQLQRDDERIKIELLNKEEYSYLKEFYAKHFDEIVRILDRLNSRLAIEDIMALEPSIFTNGTDDFLFMKQVNDAIKNEVITSCDFIG